jgi:hypothetical protein
LREEIEISLQFVAELNTKLYDLDTVIREMNDMSAQHPDLVRNMESIFKKEHVASVNSRFRMKALGDE